MGIPEKIKALQEEIHKTQVNKATEFHIGLLKAKIARLKREMEENPHGKLLSSSHVTAGFDLKRAGDATVVLIGMPSVGKSTLLNALTNAKSKISSYKFTTLTAVPGIMDYLGAKIQVLDLPGIIEGAADGKGLGKRVLSVARNADLILFIVDVFQPENLVTLKKELSQIGVKTDQDPPNVKVEKTSNGGISLKIESPIKLTNNLIKEILHVYGIHNGRVTIKEPGLTEEQFIDVLNGNAVYVPSLLVINKIDLVDQFFLEEIQPKIQREFIPISAESNTNIDTLKKAIYHKLDFIRIYMHPKGQKIDYKEPMIMRNGCTIEDLCNKIHRRMLQDFRFAYLSGPSAKFDGQKVGLDHMLLDEDIVTIVKRINAS